VSEAQLPRRDIVLPVIIAALLGVGLWAVPVRDQPAPPVAAAAPACGDCHDEVQAAWSGSNHALAQREPGPHDPVEAAVGGEERAVVGIIGVEPLHQPLVAQPGVPGALWVSPTAYDVVREEWFEAVPGPPLTWNRSCASCHATEVRKGFDGTGYATTWSSLGVGCVACHGGGAEHATGGAPPEEPGAGWTEVCAACHARRAELTDGYEPGAPFLEHFAPQLVDGVHHYLDGQIREEVFEYTSFVGSRMHAAGVGCVDCHEPHSGALRRPGDTLCRGCHDGLGTQPHDLHEEPLACIDCHMPTTTYMARDPRHDHGFLLPDPVSAAAVGLPDPCVGCHDDAARVEAAYAERYEGGHRERAALLQRASEGDQEVASALAEAVRHGAVGERVTAATLAAGLAGVREVVDALEEAAADEHDLVRFAAVSTLASRGVGQAVLRQALGDPVRAVRVAAARGLVGELVPGSEEARSYEGYLKHNADQPEALVERASWALSRRQPEEAVAPLQQALRIDPAHVPAWDALAVVHAARGDAEAALQAARQASHLAPDDAELRFRLGLAQAEAGRVSDALVTLDALPEHPRALLQAGLLAVQSGDHEGGLRRLFRAEDQAPDDVEVRYAIAWALWSWGRHDDARLAARRVLQLAPDHAGARALLAR